MVICTLSEVDYIEHIRLKHTIPIVLELCALKIMFICVLEKLPGKS